MMAHGMPKPGGKLPPPQFVASSSRAYDEMIKANEQNQIMHIDRYLEEGLKLDYWWMDAGWYIQQQGWPQVGTWEVDPRAVSARLPADQRSRPCQGRQDPRLVRAGARDARHVALREASGVAAAGPSPGDTMAGLCSWSSSELGGSDPCVTHNPTPPVRSFAQSAGSRAGCRSIPEPRASTASCAGRRRRPASTRSGRRSWRSTRARRPTSTCCARERHCSTAGSTCRGSASRRATRARSAGQGDTLDFVVGWGNGTHVCDSTGLEIAARRPAGQTYDAAKEFDAEQNPAGRGATAI